MATATFDSGAGGDGPISDGPSGRKTEASPPDPTLGESSFRYDDGITRMFATATVVWAVVATAIGTLLAVLFLLPQMFYPLGWLGEYLTFGRLRPLHTNLGIFAFVGNAVFAAVYYSTQRLCKARMWSDALSRLHFWSWQAIIVAALVTLPLGITQGKEYAELEWPIDIAIAVVWVGFFGLNFFMTLARRREPHLYVSLWFYIASLVTVTVLHVFNNLVLPIGWGKSYSLYAGVHDALIQWWYGHNAVGFFVTMPFLGLMYYFLPKAADRPIFSYKLAVVNFWSLMLIYIWIGPHHLHYTALPEWASTLGMLFSLMLWMPSWAGMLNGLLTLRGAWHKVAADPVLKFFVVGLVCYGISTFGGPLISIKSVNALSHYSDWTIAHVHMGTLGWSGMMTFGMMYWMMPRLFQTPLWSSRVASWHFWLALAGIVLYVVPIYAAGIIEGVKWNSLDDTGQLAYPEFLNIMLSVRWLWALRLVGGLLFVGGILLLGLNYVKTWAGRPSVYEDPVHVVGPSAVLHPTPAAGQSRLEGAPVLELGKKLDVVARLEWHRPWERRPGRIALLVLLLVTVGSVLEILPVFLIRGNIPVVPGVQPYTPLELAGRDIYIAEGCFNCHSQMVRPLVAETKRFGEYSRAGEFIYDHPFQWGSRRIGPDLARVGRRHKSNWHWMHLENPSAVTPGTRMPAFDHLLDTPIDFDKIPERVWAAHWLGASYNRALVHSVEMARDQAAEIAAEIVSQGGPVQRTLPNGEKIMVMDTQAVALIAYLQRLGTDLTRPAPADLVPPAATGAAPGAETGAASGAEAGAEAGAAPAAEAAGGSPSNDH